MPVLTPTSTRTASEIEIQYDPAYIPGGAVRAHIIINKPGARYDGRPYSAILVDTSGEAPTIQVLNADVMTLDGAAALAECINAAIDVIENPPDPPDPPEGTLPDVAPVTLEPEFQDFEDTPGLGTFVVTMTGQGVSNSWTVDLDSEATPWLNPMSPPLHQPQTHTPGSVSFEVSQNETSLVRTANFYVNGKTFRIQQAAKPLEEDVAVAEAAKASKPVHVPLRSHDEPPTEKPEKHGLFGRRK